MDKKVFKNSRSQLLRKKFDFDRSSKNVFDFTAARNAVLFKTMSSSTGKFKPFGYIHSMDVVINNYQYQSKSKNEL